MPVNLRDLTDVTFGDPDQVLASEARRTDAELPADAMALVDLTPPGIAPGIEVLPDGSIVVAMDAAGTLVGAEGAPGDPMEHGANLAEYLDAATLSKIAGDVDEWVRADALARSEWFERLADGIELQGLAPSPGGTANIMELAGKTHYPLIAEAAVQFQARAIAELVPPSGPAKGKIIGARTKEVEEQSTRVADYLNYQLMEEDRGTYYDEMDRLLYVLACNGSQFKKVYKDELERRVVSRWIRGDHLLVPHGCTSLNSAPRYTLQIPTSKNDMRRLQASGFYRDVPLGMPTDGPLANERLKEAQDRAEGQQDADKYLLDDEDHVAWECYCYYDLPGFEDIGDDGQPTGIGLPYIVTVDKDSLQVLAIRRNWKEEDALKTRQRCIVHFPFLPGDGFYSKGLIHFIGGTAHAVTGQLRAIILGCAFAGMNGGFKSKDARIPSDVSLEYGVYKEVDMTSDELQKCFFTPSFKGPSEADFKTLELMIGVGRRFASTTESMVGDASNTGPVGTTVALIEQGSKVHSGIHTRLHQAIGEELRLIADLNGQHLPEEGYPYEVAGAPRSIARADFDGRVDVVPVSDPNIFSTTQRIAIAQAVQARADAKPQAYDEEEVERYFLESLRVPDFERFLRKAQKPPRCDPVTENSRALMGSVIGALQDQAHPSHIAVHMDLMHRMEAEKNPLLQQLAPVMMAHIAEHIAYQTRIEYAMAMGVQLPPLGGEEQQPIPPQVENQLAQMAAAAIQRLPAPGGQDAGAQAQALSQQAQELDQARQQIAAEKSEIERGKMRLEFGRREGALREQLAQARRQMAGQRMTAEMQRMLDEAVAKVEASLRGPKE